MPDETRTSLRLAITAVAEEKQRLASLTAAQTRCTEEIADHAAALAEALAEAQDHLRELKTIAPANMAYALANREDVTDIGLAEVEATLARHHRAADHLAEIDRALTAEIQEVQARRRRAYVNRTAALADVINNPDEIQILLTHLEDAFASVRGIRKAFDAITVVLKGNLSSELLSKWQSSPPLDHNAVGFPLDESPSQAWTAALDSLLTDPDTELPRPVNGP